MGNLCALVSYSRRYRLTLTSSRAGWEQLGKHDPWIHVESRWNFCKHALPLPRTPKHYKEGRATQGGQGLHSWASHQFSREDSDVSQVLTAMWKFASLYSLMNAQAQSWFPSNDTPPLALVLPQAAEALNPVPHLLLCGFYWWIEIIHNENYKWAVLINSCYGVGFPPAFLICWSGIIYPLCFLRCD